MNTKTYTITLNAEDQAQKILIQEYIEVKNALSEMLENLREAGREESILTNILSDQKNELFRMICAYYPNWGADRVSLMIELFESF